MLCTYGFCLKLCYSRLLSNQGFCVCVVLGIGFCASIGLDTEFVFELSIIRGFFFSDLRITDGR